MESLTITKHPNYYITSNGEVYNKTTHNRVEEHINPCGYTYVILDGKWCTIAYMMKALFFADEPHFCIGHKDGDRTNNRLSNLYTYGEGFDEADNIRPGRKRDESRQICQYTMDGQIVDVLDSLTDAAEAVGLKNAIGIIKCLNGKQVSAGGFRWGYYDEPLASRTDVDVVNYRRPICQYTMDGQLVKVWDNQLQAAKAVGLVDGSTIGECIKGRRQSAGGFIWTYYGETLDEQVYKVAEQRRAKEEAKRIKEAEKAAKRAERAERKRIKEAAKQETKRRRVCQYTMDGQLVNMWKNQLQAARGLGLSNSNTISFCLNGKRQTAGGFRWAYEGEPLVERVDKRFKNK